MSKDIKDFVTLAYAGDKEFLATLTNQLDQLPQLQKSEDGSPDSEDGHSITYFVKDKLTDRKKDLFFAMIHSNGENYLIRADKNLFEVA